jgi:ABC-type multidrug transport system fused ATPase/permease subunit
MQSIQTKAILRVFWEHLRRHNTLFIATFILIVIASVVEILVPVFYKRFFDLLVAGTNDSLLVYAILFILVLHLIAWVAWRSSGFIESWRVARVHGKTAIVIAHRLSTIMEMDRILVIEGGKVVDDGTHTQLIRRKDGIYKTLWEIQAGGFIN